MCARRVWWQRPVPVVEAEEGHDELELAFRIFDADHVRRAIPARAAVAAAAQLLPPWLLLSFQLRTLQPWQDGRISSEELTEVFTNMGERLSPEEMDEFLGWLGLRDGGSVNLVTFKSLPCWQPEEGGESAGNSPKRKGMLAHFSQTREKALGTVSVRVVRATGLLAADSGGTSDPYVLVALPTRYDGGNSSRTSAKKKTLNPEWGETLETLHVYDAPDRCMISFSVWDHDNIGMNDDLGTGEALPNPNPNPNPNHQPQPQPFAPTPTISPQPTPKTPTLTRRGPPEDLRAWSTHAADDCALDAGHHRGWCRTAKVT